MRYDDQLRLFQEQAAARFERDSKKDGKYSFCSVFFSSFVLLFLVVHSSCCLRSFYYSGIRGSMFRYTRGWEKVRDVPSILFTVILMVCRNEYLAYLAQGFCDYLQFLATINMETINRETRCLHFLFQPLTRSFDGRGYTYSHEVISRLLFFAGLPRNKTFFHFEI